MANDKGHLKEAQPSAKDSDRQGDLQKKAVERFEEADKETKLADIRTMFNSKLVTKEFKGNHPAEPFKSDEEEATKQGRLEVKKVKTIPLEVDGKVIDQIVVDPPPLGGQIGGAMPETDNQRVQRVLDKHFGRDKEKGETGERNRPERKAVS